MFKKKKKGTKFPHIVRLTFSWKLQESPKVKQINSAGNVDHKQVKTFKKKQRFHSSPPTNQLTN